MVITPQDIKFPELKIVITKGRFVLSAYILKLEKIENGSAFVTVERSTPDGAKRVDTLPVSSGTKLDRTLNDNTLRDYKVLDLPIRRRFAESQVAEGNQSNFPAKGEILQLAKPWFRQTQRWQTNRRVKSPRCLSEQAFPMRQVINFPRINQAYPTRIPAPAKAKRPFTIKHCCDILVLHIR